MEIGRIGAWLGALAVAPSSAARAAAAEVEALGYETLWFPEGLGTREAMSNAGVLIGATERMTVATGIANIWARDATAAACGARTLGDASDGRFLLGLGVSHPAQVDPRGHRYARPVATMSAYLDAMDAGSFDSPDAEAGDAPPPVERVLAALRPRMLRLAAERAAGAHPYLVTVEHTVQARELLGPGPLLAPELGVVLDADPSRARARARAHLSWYLGTPNYVECWRWLGFDESDWSGAGSDRLVDALIAWGDEDAIKARVDAHLAAGADHVAIQPLGADDDPIGLDVLRRLAPALVP